mgnify:CR=1 FL=1
MRTIAVYTLGCKVNQYDTEAMLELFERAGYVSAPFDSEADIYLINTCTVTGTGDQKSLKTVRRVARLHPDCAIIVCGCLAQRLADETKTKAQAEADELLNKAREEAQQTVNDAKAQAEALTERTNSDVAAAKAEYDKLHASAEEYRASFRKLIEAQLQTLKANDLLFK